MSDSIATLFCSSEMQRETAFCLNPHLGRQRRESLTTHTSDLRKAAFPLCSMALFLFRKGNILQSYLESECKDRSIPFTDLSVSKSASLMYMQRHRIEFRLQTRFKILACVWALRHQGNYFFQPFLIFHVTPISSNSECMHTHWQDAQPLYG